MPRATDCDGRGETGDAAAGDHDVHAGVLGSIMRSLSSAPGSVVGARTAMRDTRVTGWGGRGRTAATRVTDCQGMPARVGGAPGEPPRGSPGAGVTETGAPAWSSADQSSDPLPTFTSVAFASVARTTAVRAVASWSMRM